MDEPDPLDHLQAAAREIIEAARAFLDLLDDLVNDRERMRGAIDTVTELAEAASRLGAPDRGSAKAGADPPGHEGDDIEPIAVS